MSDISQSVRGAIETKLQEMWAHTPIAWEGSYFDPTEDVDEWIQPNILWGEGFISTTNGRNMVVGSLITNIFVRPARGLRRVHDLVAIYRPFFNTVELLAGALRFGVSSGPQSTRDPRDTAWVQMAVTNSFVAEEVI